MRRIKTADIASLMQELRQVTGTPRTQCDPYNRKGFLLADYQPLYGGWQLLEVSGQSGKESQGPLGFPSERVNARCFYNMISVAISSHEAGIIRMTETL